MKERLLTIVLSVVTTILVMNMMETWHQDPLTAIVTPAMASETIGQPVNELVVDRLIVRKELIVSDTGKPWDDGFEKQEIPRGMVARSLGSGVAGIWVRGRIIKSEIDDPFDDRFNAINRDGSVFGNPGHISWNAWIGENWRQMAIIQGEMLDPSEMPTSKLNGDNHPGRLRFQSFRPNHSEPLTDALIGQGMMALGGGGYGGGGLPFPSEVLQLWGGEMQVHALARPGAPKVIKDDKSGTHTYALIAVGPQGDHSEPSDVVTAQGRATIAWDSDAGADAYIVIHDGKPTKPLRIEGSEKRWTDSVTEP